MQPVSAVSDAIVSPGRLVAMRAGAHGLVRWLRDRCADGLASLADDSAGFDQQVARLHNDKLPGLARWLAFVEQRVGQDEAWPMVVAGELGRIAVLALAWERYDALPDGVRASVLVRSGVSVRRDTVREVGERIPGLWTAIGEQVQEDERGLVSRRTAFIGPRPALVVDYQFGQVPPPAAPVGNELFAELVFWPGVGSVRALVDDAEPTEPWTGDGATSLEEALNGVAQAFAANPLCQRVPLAIRDVTAVRHDDRTWLRDDTGHALPIHGDRWELIAQTSLAPVTVGAVWRGRSLDIVSVVADGVYRPLPVEEVALAPATGRAVDETTRRLLIGADLSELVRAGERSIASRAAPIVRTVPAAPVIKDARTPLAPAATRGLERALRAHPTWLDVVCDLLRLHRARVGSPLLERLLGVHRDQWAQVDDVLGPSERQIAGLDDRWRWAASAPLSVGWERPELRPACLFSAVRDDPEEAMVQLARRWSGVERATDRVALLSVLRAAPSQTVRLTVSQLPHGDAVTVMRAVQAVVDARPEASDVPWTVEQVQDWRQTVERAATRAQQGEAVPLSVLNSFLQASRNTPLALSDRVRAPLAGLRTTDPNARQLIAASRDAADRIALRIRFQPVDPRPNGAMSGPVG